MGKKLYQDIMRHIQRDYPAGEQLPSERELASMHHCSRTTIRAALALLTSKGLVTKQARSGNRLLKSAENTTSNTKTKIQGIIVMFVSSASMRDGNYLDMMAGALSQATSLGFLMLQIPCAEPYNPPEALDTLHPGIAPCGYIIATHFPVPMLKLLRTTNVPCIFLGDYPESMAMMADTHFFHCYLPLAGRYGLAMRKLLDAGCRRILVIENEKVLGQKELKVLASINEQLQREYNLPDDAIDILSILSQPSHMRVPQEHLDAILEHARRADGIEVNSGNRQCQEVYLYLTRNGIRIPEDVKFICQSGRLDYFTDLYDLATVYNDGADEGIACVNELCRQFLSRHPVSGIHYSEHRFYPNNSISSKSFENTLASPDMRTVTIKKEKNQ